MKQKIEKTDWGIIKYFFNDYSRFALYQYDDDKSIVYLSNVYVNEEHRGNGEGNHLLMLALEEAKIFNADYIVLKCLKNNFVYHWYERNGFYFLSDDDNDEKYVWMMKDL